jgi:hypothetical protein
MMKRIVPLGLVLPIVACAASSPERSQSSASPLAFGDVCICAEPDPTPSNTGGGSQDRCDPQCENQQSITIAPGQENVGVVVEATTDWPDPAHVSFSIGGLPAGVTATYVQTSPYIPPAQGITGAFEFTAAPSATPGVRATATITATSGGVTSYAYVDITIGGTCAPTTTCGGHCGTVDDGCSHALSCGLCPSGQYCTAANVCQGSGGGCIGTKKSIPGCKWVCCGSDGWECNACQ